MICLLVFAYSRKIKKKDGFSMTHENLSRSKRLYSHRYLPGFDGFRAVAVLAIIIFHLNAQWLPGGFLGVDTFFVISGYLITSLLISEFEMEGQYDYGTDNMCPTIGNTVHTHMRVRNALNY